MATYCPHKQGPDKPPTNPRGYWWCVDKPGELGKVQEYEYRRDANAYGATTKDDSEHLRETLQAKHPEGTVRVWKMRTEDFGPVGFKEWSPKRQELELALALNNGTFTPAQAWVDKQAQVNAKPLPDPSPYREWSKAKREEELAQAYADGRFTPTPAYLEAHPELEAKAAVLAAGAQITKPRKARAPKPVESDTIAEPAPAVVMAPEPEKRAEKPPVRKQRPSAPRRRLKSWQFAWCGGVR